MRHSWMVIALAFFAAIGSEARADLITTFNASGSFRNGAALTGTITLDTDLGVATAMDLHIGPPTPLDFNSAPDTVDASAFHHGIFIEGTSSTFTLLLAIPVDTLQGYVGGDLASRSLTPFAAVFSELEPGEGSVFELDTGTLSPAATPEPATLTLLGTGLLTIGATRLDRRRRRAAMASGQR